MAGDLVLIVLKVKLIVIGQLLKEEGRISTRTPEEVERTEMTNLRAEFGSGKWERRELLCHSLRMLSLTSSPLGIRRLEMMMILSSLSNVTTSATQLGAQE